MNDSIITHRQVVDLKDLLDQIRRSAGSPPSPHGTERPLTAEDKLSLIERLARKAGRILP